MSDVKMVAIDDGYAQIKLFGDAPNGGAPIRSVFRTSVSAGRFGLVNLDGQGGDSFRTEEGEEYTVSDEIKAENTQFDGFHISPMNRALVHHGLTIAGYAGHDVSLMTGLPVADYFSAGKINQAMVDAKSANLRKGVSRVSSPAPLANLVDIGVGCQAVAAWMDYAIDTDTLEIRDGSARPTAIVDIGGRTTDIAVVMQGRSIDFAQSGTQNVGVLDVYKALQDLIRKEFKIKDEFPLAMLDKAVRSRKLQLWGDDQDIDKLVTDAITDVAGKISREVERRLGSAAALSAVVFVGGGASLFKEIPESMRNGVLLDDGEFANARGLWKFAQIRAQRAQAA